MREAAPLILTLGLAAEDQARFDRLREAHFPAERNFIAAHVTLFHHLPGEDEAGIRSVLEMLALRTAAFAVRVSGVRSLGRGTALALESEALMGVRRVLASSWADALSAQDRQGFRPHVTVQNKVSPGEARALQAALSAEFAPFSIGATGLSLWRYVGGPWEAVAAYAFTGR